MRMFASSLLAIAALTFAASCGRADAANKEPSTMSATMKPESVAFADPGIAPLADAVARGDLATIRALAPTANLATRGDQDVTLLEWAIWNQQPAALAALLDAGADPALPGVDGETVVHMAAMTDDASYLKVLLDHGAPADTVAARAGWTPLFRAVESRRDAQVDMLVAAGADIHRVDSMGNSLLHQAAKSGASSLLVPKLLDLGVDPTLENAQQSTFQPYFFMTPERLLNAPAREARSAVQAWLAAKQIPVETKR